MRIGRLSINWLPKGSDGKLHIVPFAFMKGLDTAEVRFDILAGKWEPKGVDLKPEDKK